MDLCDMFKIKTCKFNLNLKKDILVIMKHF